METILAQRAAVFDSLLSVWNGSDSEQLSDLITNDYRGHMLHLADGERTSSGYADWIRDYRLANPGATFLVEDQTSEGDRLWTRLRAHLPGGAVAHGFNISRFEGRRIAEEWALWSPWASGL
jgi:predicted ester cyclase